MEERKKIKLNFPIEIMQADGSKITYSEVEIGRLKNKHLKAFPKDFVKSGGKVSPDQLVPVISVVCGLPIEVVDEMDLEDTEIISEALESFLAGSQMTGKK